MNLCIEHKVRRRTLHAMVDASILQMAVNLLLCSFCHAAIALIAQVSWATQVLLK